MKCPNCGREMNYDKEDHKWFCDSCRDHKYSASETMWRDME